MGVIIKHIQFFLPQCQISNTELSKRNPDWDIDKIEKKSGVKMRHIADAGQTALDLAVGAVQRLLDTENDVFESIDAIIFCTQSPDLIMPSNSFLLHKHFGFSQRVWTFDYNLACSGYIYGLGIVRGIIETGLAKNVLLINADTYSKLINPRDRSTSVLFGDGAAASLISKSQEEGILDVILSANGEKFDSFYVPAGGMKMPKSELTKEEAIDHSGNFRSLEDIHMNGFAVWQFIAENVPKQINTLLEKNDLRIDDIDMFIFHQASKLTIDSLIKVLKLNPDKVIINLGEIGNTVSASIPIAIKEADLNAKIKRGDLLLLSGFGVGLSWGSLLIRY
jgi:3-oxoacyl-[acyl-carrier-protein] synthase-3